MNGRRGAAGAVAAVLGILFTIFTASPAAAAPAGSFDSPAEGDTVDSSDVTFKGRFTASEGGRLEGPIVLTVADQRFELPVTSPADQPFEKAVTIPANGTYKAVATVHYRDWPYQLNNAYPHPIERTITVEALPAGVQGITAKVDEAKRTVAVSWKANSEPDIVGYLVRRAVNKGKFADVGAAKADELTFFDKLTDQDPAGTYRYQVMAVRKRANPSSQDYLVGPAGASQATVKTAPASGTTTPTTGANGSTSGGGATQPGAANGAAPAAGGKVDMAKFNNLLGTPTLGAAPKESAPLTPQANLAGEEEEDGGYSDRLPYGPDGIPGTEDDGEREMEIVDEARSSSNERPTTLLSLGGAALAAMLVALTRWILNEVNRAEDGLAPVEPAAEGVALAELADFMPPPVVEEAPAPVRRQRPLRSPMRPQRDLVGTAPK